MPNTRMDPTAAGPAVSGRASSGMRYMQQILKKYEV